METLKTTGQIFSDGHAIEIVRAVESGTNVTLLHRDGEQSRFVSGTANGGSALLKVDLVGNVHVLWGQKGSIAPWNVPLAHRWGPSAPWAVPSPDGRHLAVYVWSHGANMWSETHD